MLHENRVIAIAADYADALLVARRAKRLIVLLLVLIVLAHLAIFFTAHFAPDVLRGGATSATQPTRWNAGDFLHFFSAASLFASVVLSVLLVLTLFLTIHIMLVGRLIGVRDVTRALVTSFVLLILLVPWQTLLVTQGLGTTDVVLPGILPTWREIDARALGGNAAFATADAAAQALYWGRFAALPILGLVLLLLVQVRSGRGLKCALGEESIVTATPDDAVMIHRDNA